MSRLRPTEEECRRAYDSWLRGKAIDYLLEISVPEDEEGEWPPDDDGGPLNASEIESLQRVKEDE